MTNEAPISLRTTEDVTPAAIAAAVELAQAFEDYDDSGRPVTDWEEVYDQLESQAGFFVEEMDSPADRKIRRAVRAALRGSE